MKRHLLIITTTLFSFLGFAQMNPDFSPNHEVTLCGPTDVFFVCTSPADPDNIWWDFGDGTTGMGLNPIHRYTTTGIYAVKMIVQKDNVKDSITKADFITLNPKPVSSFTTDITEVPKAYQRKFKFTGTSNADSIIQYDWMINGTSVPAKASLLYTFPSNGTYPVSLTVTNNKGCSDEFVDSILIQDEPDWPTATKEVLVSERLAVSINVTQPLVTITRGMQSTEEATINILDITGRVVYQTKMNKGEATLQVSTDALRPGAYIVELKSQSFTAAKRFDKIMM
ncbi:MAG: PKD domain-containing protein [Bacteroidota bacterium]